MKKFLFAIFALLLGCAVYADAPRGWTTDLKQAQLRAGKENKKILLLFTGSDWCPPCKAFKKNVFDRKAFMSYAKDNFVLVYFDFPRRSEIPAAQMAEQRKWQRQLGIQGYPTVIIMDAKGKVLGKSVGGKTEKDFLKWLQRYSNRKVSRKRR